MDHRKAARQLGAAVAFGLLCVAPYSSATTLIDYAGSISWNSNGYDPQNVTSNTQIMTGPDGRSGRHVLVGAGRDCCGGDGSSPPPQPCVAFTNAGWIDSACRSGGPRGEQLDERIGLGRRRLAGDRCHAIEAGHGAPAIAEVSAH